MSSIGKLFFSLQNNPSRMKYYVALEAVNIWIYVLLFVHSLIDFNGGVSYSYLTCACLECYVAICVYSIYRDCLNSSSHGYAENMENMRLENNAAPSLQYDKCEKGIILSNTGGFTQNHPVHSKL